MEESAPGAFNETVGTLSFGRGYDGLGFFVVDPSDALSPHDFPVEVGVGVLDESSDVRTKLVESVDDIV